MTWIVVGISGPTCSGKTSLANKVHEYLKNSIIIHQDKYFLPENDPRHIHVPELNHHNWEILSSLDMKKMHSDILDIVKSTSLDTQESTTNLQFLIVEGFSIFAYKPIADLCQVKYFIDANRQLCSNRRNNRVYNPPDVPGYFDKIVWPEYEKYKNNVMCDINLSNSITFLNGSKSMNDLFDQVVTSFQHLLQI